MTKYLITILMAIARYDTLIRAQIQRLCCPKDKDGRATRKRLLQLVLAGLLNKTRMEVCNPAGGGAPAIVYYSSKRGLEFLAAELKDERYLAYPYHTPLWMHLYHYTEVAECHIRFDEAVEFLTEQGIDCDIEGWIGERHLRDPEAKEPHKRFELYELLQEKPRVVSIPDARFVLRLRTFRKGYFVEWDRRTSGVDQIANSKTPGFALMEEKEKYLRHFPGIVEPDNENQTPFTVLHISPTAGRRDLVRKAFLKAKAKGMHLWKFASWSQVTKETLLTAPIWYPCEGDPAPLINLSGMGRNPSGPVPDQDGSGHAESQEVA